MNFHKELLDPDRSNQEIEKLENNLYKRIIGQTEAIEAIVGIYKTYLAKLHNPEKPIGNLLFLGPTGTGKTRIVEVLAESVAGDVHAVLKIDCAEFQHSHEIAKLVGSPPGYLGHRETHPLITQEKLGNGYKLSFLLFDEIEKANDALWNLLLGILDKAILTLGDNSRVDFSQSMIFMTSNLGADKISAVLQPKMGFAALKKAPRQAASNSEQQAINRSGLEAARRKFNPEFFNRLDKVVVFRPLGKSELRQILELELDLLQQRVFRCALDVPFVFRLTESAKEHLLQEGMDMRYGARYLKRTVERNLVQPFSSLITTGQVKNGDLVQISWNSKFIFSKEAEGLTAQIMEEIGRSVPGKAAAAGI